MTQRFRAALLVLLVVCLTATQLVAGYRSAIAFEAQITTASLPGAVVSVNPARVVDSRINQQLNGAIPAQAVVSIQITGRGGIPATGVGAAVLNVTAVDPQTFGHLDVWPSGVSQSETSSLNFQAGQNIPNAVIVPVGADGKVRVFNGSLGTVQLVVDVNGYIVAGVPTAAGAMVSLNPARIVDSRINLQLSGPIPAQTSVAIQVTGRGGIPSSGVAAAVLNVIAVDPQTLGHLDVRPSDVPRSETSNLNFQAGQNIPNAVIAPVGADGKIQVFNGSLGTVHLVIDVNGYTIAGDANAAGAAVSLRPSRIVDSRISQQVNGPISPQTTASIQVAGQGGIPTTGIAAAILNVTAVDPQTLGYLDVWPSGVRRSETSNLNFQAGQNIPNAVIAPVGADGKIQVFNGSLGTVHLVIDVNGYIVSAPTPGSKIPVSNLTVGHAFRSAIQLGWALPTGTAFTKIAVRRANGTSAPSGPDQGVDVPTGDAITTEVVDDGLTSMTTYSYSVFVLDANGRASAPTTATATTGGTPAPSGPTPGTTTVVAAENMVGSSANADGSEVSVQLAAGSPATTAGGHLVLPPSDVFPDGMVAEVLRQQTAGDGTVTDVVRQTSIDDALPNVVIDQDMPIQLDPVITPDANVAATKTADGATTLALAPKLFSCHGANGTSLDPADLFDSPNLLPITVEFSNYHWLHNFDAGSLFPSRPPSLLLQLTGEADISMEVRPKVDAFSCELDPTWRRHHRLFRVRVGTVPGTALPITVSLEIGLSFSVSAQGGVKLTQHRYWGFTIQKHASDPMVSARSAGSADPTQLSASGSAGLEASLFGDLSIMMGGGYKSANAQIGVYGTLGPFLSIKGEVQSGVNNVCLTADIGFKSTLGVRLELWAKRWNLELGDATWAKKSVFNKCVPSSDVGNNAVRLGLGGTLGTLGIFAPADEALAYLRQYLGAPDTDSGWILPLCGPSPGNVHWRLIRWDALELMLMDTPVPLPDGPASGPPVKHVVGWTYYQKVGPVVPRLQTNEGITLGSTRAELEAAYGDALQPGPPSTFPGQPLEIFFGDFSNMNFEFGADDTIVAITSGQSGCGD
jgi:chitodextrinase